MESGVSGGSLGAAAQQDAAPGGGADGGVLGLLSSRRGQSRAWGRRAGSGDGSLWTHLRCLRRGWRRRRSPSYPRARRAGSGRPSRDSLALELRRLPSWAAAAGPGLKNSTTPVPAAGSEPARPRSVRRQDLRGPAGGGVQGLWLHSGRFINPQTSLAREVGPAGPRHRGGIAWALAAAQAELLPNQEQ